MLVSSSGLLSRSHIDVFANYRRESHITGRPKTATFVRPHCVPNPKIAEIHLLRHCRDRDAMFGRRDMEHKATEVYRYYRSLRDSLSDSIEVIEVIEVIS